VIKKLILSCFVIAGISNFSLINASPLVDVTVATFLTIIKAGDIVISSANEYYVAKDGILFRCRTQQGQAFTAPSGVEVVTGKIYLQ